MQDRQLAVCAETLGKLYTNVVWVFVNGCWIYSTVLLFHRLIGRFCFYSPLSEFSKEVLPMGRGSHAREMPFFRSCRVNVVHLFTSRAIRKLSGQTGSMGCFYEQVKIGFFFFFCKLVEACLKLSMLHFKRCFVNHEL